MENLFEFLSHPDSVFFLLCMLVAFLIGFISAWGMWGSQARRYMREAADWKKKYDDQVLELASLREKLDLSTADLAKARREAELAIEQATATQREKLKWQKDLDQSLEETVRLQASSHSYQATIEDLNNQIIGLKTRNEQLAAAGGQVDDEKIKEIQVSYSATLGQLAMLETKVNQLTAENEALQASAKKEDENVITLLKSYKDSTNRLGGLEEKLGSLMAENQALQNELAGLKAATDIGVSTKDVEMAFVPTINPADKEAITSGAISPSDAKNEVLAAIGGAIPSATADQKNDLTEIKGIGSFLEKKLNALGIYTFEQISHFDANLVEKVTAAIEFFPGRIERDDWVGQAKRLTKPKGKKKTSAAASAKADDLKIVEGIGPKIEKLLNEAGILTLKELSTTTSEQLKAILLNAGEHFRIHDPNTWPEQARLAASSEFDKLKAYQDFLSGGKDPGKA